MRILKIRYIAGSVEFELRDKEKAVYRYHNVKEIEFWGDKKFIICEIVKSLHKALDHYEVLLSGKVKLREYLLKPKFEDELC